MLLMVEVKKSVSHILWCSSSVHPLSKTSPLSSDWLPFTYRRFKQHVGRVSGLTAREVYLREKKLPNKIKNRTTDPLKAVMTLQNATQLKKAPRNIHIYIHIYTGSSTTVAMVISHVTPLVNMTQILLIIH